jgi:hypothetical protein
MKKLIIICLFFKIQALKKLSNVGINIKVRVKCDRSFNENVFCLKKRIIFIILCIHLKRFKPLYTYIFIITIANLENKN